MGNISGSGCQGVGSICACVVVVLLPQPSANWSRPPIPRPEKDCVRFGEPSNGDTTSLEPGPEVIAESKLGVDSMVPV